MTSTTNPFPLAFFTEREYDQESDCGLVAVCSRTYYCLACYDEEYPAHAEAVYTRTDLSGGYGHSEECGMCGIDLYTSTR